MTEPYDYARTGPGTLAGRYLRMFWQPVARLEDIAPGTTRPIRIMGEAFTLYRGESGAVYLVDFRCAHRGAQLSIGWVEGETIRCRYHGWRYDGTGQCVEQPGEGEEGFCGRVRIDARPTQLYKGLVFAWLGDDAPPAFPEYPSLDGDGVIEAIVYMRRCNYFNNIDNQLDEVHVSFVHRDAFHRVLDLPMVDARRTEYGAATYCPRPNGNVRVTHFLMPNVTQLKSPGADREIDWTEYVVWRVPIDDESHYTFGINYISVHGDAKSRYLARRAAVRETPPIEEIGERILRGELTIEDAKANLDDRDVLYHVYLEDYAVQVGQGAIADRSRENLGRTDAGVRLLREIWNEELRRLAMGEAPTCWTRPAALDATTGDSPRTGDPDALCPRAPRPARDGGSPCPAAACALPVPGDVPVVERIWQRNDHR